MRKLTLATLFTGLLAASIGAALSAGPSSITVVIRPEPGFYIRESGKAVLTAEGASTRVVVNVNRGVPKGSVEPIHIHAGVCGKIDPKPKWALNSLQDGKSETVIPVSLDELLKGTYAINVHKDPQNIAVYVACGNITAEK